MARIERYGFTWTAERGRATLRCDRCGAACTTDERFGAIAEEWAPRHLRVCPHRLPRIHSADAP